MATYGPHYLPGKWCVGDYNYLDEVRKAYRLPRRFHFRDTTLREGDEQPFSNALFTPERKLMVAEKLYDLGLREMELGYPGPVDEHFGAIRLIKKEIPEMRVTAFARAMSPEWRMDVDRCAEAGVDGIDILDYACDVHLELMGVERNQVLARDIEAIEYAKTTGKEVCFGPINATRTDWEFYRKLVMTGMRAGIDRFTFYEDGHAAPPAVMYLVGKVKDLVGDLPVLFHAHDDFGLSTANTLAAVEAGAEAADACLNGMGDKAGVAALEEVAVSLEALYGVKTGIKLEKLYETSVFLQELTGVRVQPHKPVVGSNMFVHESELHAYCILRGCWESMEPYRAETVGQKAQVIIGDTTLHGLAVRTYLDNLGVKYTDEDIQRIIAALKKELTLREYVSLDELKEMAVRLVN